MRNTLTQLSVIIAISSFALISNAQVPDQWVYSGYLTEGDAAYTGSVEVTVELYDTATEGFLLWSEQHASVSAQAGSFTLELGSVSDLTDAVLTGEVMWLQLIVEGDRLSPRVPVGSVPYAQHAAVADQSLNSSGVFVGTTPIVDGSGQWVGPNIPSTRIDQDWLRDIESRLARLETALQLDDGGAQRLSELEDAQALVEEILELTESDISARFVRNESSIADLEALTSPMTHEGDDIFFTGVNVNIRSGEGSTNHSEDLFSPGSPNGLGNLIIGYNETALGGSDRDGSHNLVVGPEHSYTGFGGLALGVRASISSYGAIAAGFGNSAEGAMSVALSGHGNLARGYQAVVIGGEGNDANGSASVIVAGSDNDTTGLNAAILGGSIGDADGEDSAVVGGRSADAGGQESVAIGGDRANASGRLSVVVGGDDSQASGTRAVVVGGSEGLASGSNAVVVGGDRATASTLNSIGCSSS